MTNQERVTIGVMIFVWGMAALAVIIFLCPGPTHADWSPQWYLSLEAPVKDSMTTCDGEIIAPADRLLSRVGWLERSWMLDPYAPVPSTVRRIVPDDTLTVRVRVWNFGHKFIFHTQGLYERPDGSTFWASDAECDTLLAFVWQGHAWFPFARGNQYQVLEPVGEPWPERDISTGGNSAR